MKPSKGVRIEEMGVKFGCNGVDNAKLWFDHVCHTLDRPRYILALTLFST
jgi:hypothetical protein